MRLRRLRRLTAVVANAASRSWQRSTPRPKIIRPDAPLRGAGVAGLVIVVTGSTRGIGRALAEAFAAMGAHVVVSGRNPEAVANAVAAIAIASGSVSGIAADIGEAAGAEKLIQHAAQRFGRIDVLINNAGVSGPVGRKMWELSGDEVEDVLRVNVLGAFNCAAAAMRRMVQQGSGRIVNVSSGATELTAPHISAYGISKYGLEGLTAHLARDAEDTGVIVTTLRLGSVRTDMTRAAFSWSQAELLPEPETLAPAFLEIITAAGELVHGRGIAAWRLLQSPQAELHAKSQLALSPSFSYPQYRHNGQLVERDGNVCAVYDRAENTFGPSPLVKEALGRAVENRPLAVYPDDKHAGLRTALSSFYDLPEDWFAVGNGSWEVLDRILEVFAGPGDQVVSNKPGWFGFSMLCRRKGLENIRVPFEIGKESNHPGHNLAAIAAAVTPRTRLIYLISPSNPEGIVLKKADFEAFLGEIPAEIPVLIDEAYVEYADDPERLDAISTARAMERPVIALRTFSKFYALASARVGYAVGRPSVIDLIDRSERIFNVSALSEIAAVAAMQDRTHADRVRRDTIDERRRIEKSLGPMGLDFVASQAPYMLVELPCDLQAFCEAYAKRGIFVGEKAFYKEKYVLFPVATPDRNDVNLSVLRTCA
nr:SDR family NAD(P)-dependent oxidoreductase [Mesorhizobium mediterraneum]